MRTAYFLRNVPVLAGLPEELLEQLVGQVSEVRVPAGDWILREGDRAESMFIVRGGRIEVVNEGPPETLLRVLRRGDVLGELALLREGVRTASARAQRDTELLELGRTDFEGLIEQVPRFALGLTRALGAQVAASRSPVVQAVAPRTIAVVALDAAAPAEEIGERLRRALERHGSVAHLRAGDLATVDQAEHDRDRVLLIAPGHADEDWTRLALAESDVVVPVTAGSADPAWSPLLTSLRGCELFAIGSRIDEGLLAALEPHEVQLVAPADLQSGIDLLARRLAGRSPGIVFSGGGARALAHVGVLDELEAAGLRFDRLAGVSLGSVIAALAATGLDSDTVAERCELGFVVTNPTNDFTLPFFSLIRGARTRRLLQEQFGETRIEELPKRFFSLSCDLISREPVVRRAGLVREAVYSSLAIPGVFPPVPDGNGRLLVDGGVLDNLPVATMARTGEGPVVAVDVTGPVGQFKRAQRPKLERLGRPLRRALTGSDDTIPRLGETIVRSVTVGSIDTVAAARLHADVVITPAVAGIGLLDWSSLERVRELGRQAARAALAADPELPAKLGA